MPSNLSSLDSEQGIGRGLQPLTFILNHVPPAKPAYSGGDTLTTYTAIPHYVTSHGRSLLLANTELSFFDFRAANQTTIEVVSRNLELVMFYSERPLALLNEYTRTHSGRMRALPAWASSGAVVGVQGGEERVLSVIEKLRAWNVPVAAVW